MSSQVLQATEDADNAFSAKDSKFLDLEKGSREPTLDDQDKSDDDPKQQIVKKHWSPNKAWFILVFLGLGVCWIPAILAWTKFPKARVWGVKLLFWSIWLSILWAGWWFGLVVSWIWHRILLIFVHLFGFWKLKRYVNWLEYLHGYLALFAWAAALWITWVPLITDRQMGNNGEDSDSRSVRAVNLGGRLLFALAGCTAILLAEKIAIQGIALKFHRRSYQKRIEAQKEAVKVFKVLFSLITKVPDSLKSGDTFKKRNNSQRKFRRTSSHWSFNTYLPLSENKRFNYNQYLIDRTPTSKLQTAFTDAAGQILGTGQLDTEDRVVSAFHRDGTGKMKRLAQDIWSGIASQFAVSETSGTFRLTKSTIESLYSTSGKKIVHKDSISPEKIWTVVTDGFTHVRSIGEEEFMNRCSELHDEQRRLEETMNDLQNVVGRLDDLLMLFWAVGSIIIIAVALEAELKTLIFGAGTAFVGASWLLKDAATEVLSSIIFLFMKHPFDVEDKVIINEKQYTVVEMRLLSTVFHDDDSVQVQAPNSLLNNIFIHNLRRSPATSEPFTIEVSDQTTEAQLNKFENFMIDFLKAHAQDYRADFEVTIKGLSYQDHKMLLCMVIKYNNNWKSKIDIRAKRRNRWICAVQECLRRSGIHGPATPALRVTTVTSGVPHEGSE